MQVVADANPLFSMIIKPGKPIYLLFIEEFGIICS